jgi:RND family efflux transporter MFP subunit
MKQKITDFIKSKLEFIKKHWKWTLFAVVIVMVVVPKLLPKGFDPKTEVVEVAKIMDLKKTVRATGTVTSVVDLNLAFNNAGRIANVNASLGQKVSKGQILASLSAGSELGQLNQAYGQLKSAQASLARVIEGSTNEEVRVAEVSLASAKSSLVNTERLQNTLVRNALAVLYSSSLSAVSTYISSLSSVPTISGTYTGQSPDEYTINVYPTGAGSYASYVSSNGDSGSMSTATSGPVPFGTKGLYVTFPSGMNSSETFKIKIPNTSSSVYSTNLNSYNSALDTRSSAIETAQNAVDSAEANLALKKSAARPSDISAKEADVLTAQGRVQQAQAAYEEKVIRAPMSGYITKLDVKVGENVDAKKTVMVLQDKGELFLETDINEGDIDEIKPGQIVSFTVDTLPDTDPFLAEIAYIDQSSTKTGSVVNYTVKATIKTGLDKIQTGSTANLSILINEKQNVLVVPARTIKENADGTKYVLSVASEKRGTTVNKDVTTGLLGDGFMTEILSGLVDGEKILFKAK